MKREREGANVCVWRKVGNNKSLFATRRSYQIAAQWQTNFFNCVFNFKGEKLNMEMAKLPVRRDMIINLHSLLNVPVFGNFETIHHLMNKVSQSL